MAVYRPRYIDPKTGERKQSAVWWYDFTFARKRYTASTKQVKKTLAVECEKQKRAALHRALAGIPTENPDNRINSVDDLVTRYLEHYASNHREKSVIFSTQRLAHVTRLLGKCLVPDLTEERVHDYIRTRLGEDAGGRTINMELGELSRTVGQKWSVMWPKVRKLEENHEVGRALSPEEEDRLLQTAANDRSPNRNPFLYTFLRIALATGMRVGEIMSLCWSQVDLAESVITVGKSKSRAGRGRQIPMTPDLKQSWTCTHRGTRRSSARLKRRGACFLRASATERGHQSAARPDAADDNNQDVLDVTAEGRRGAMQARSEAHGGHENG